MSPPPLFRTLTGPKRVARLSDCVYVCMCVCFQVEARSVDNLKKLNRGMENKIIELQQKLSEQVK